jgi:signal transduction histidine kinase
MSVLAVARPGRRIADAGRRAGGRWLVVDLVVVAGYLVIMTWEYLTPGLDDGYRQGSLALSVPLSVLAFAPIAIRRLRPLTALAISCASIGLPLLVVPHWVLFWSGTLPTVLLLYTVARHRPLPVALIGSTLPVLALATMVLRIAPVDALSDLAFLLTLELGVVASGVALQRSALRRRELAEVLAVLEQEQANRERLAVLDERQDLARDLHDVVAHAVSLMLVQAGAARVALRDDPALARRFLEGVDQAGRSASGDLLHLLRLLRGEDGPGGAEPAPGLAAVADLVERMRRAGVDVRLEQHGVATALPPGLDVAAYRIVQEALTNVTKHAGATRTVVRIDHGEPLRLLIEDSGPVGTPPRPATSGHGLVGVRERAALFGGAVEAGPREGGGWTVEARLPMPVP